ncbi:MAG: TetR/AcrR family transcriptional regulator [Desulfatitalea sp.]|nr:TetR/AcrR family transcriptional regulator [Desulfatitalea sp.]NNK00466.1 TetR/AcrR family transcriptional regulator [Desulfatitalea sp.]
MKQNSVTKKKPKLKPEAKQKLNAAIKKLFSAKPYSEVGMRDLAKTAGISVDTIYRHYESKEKLLVTFLVDEWLSDLRLRVTDHLKGIDSAEEKLRKISWLLHEYVEKNPEIGKIIFFALPNEFFFKSYYYLPLVQDYFMLYVELVKEGQDKGILNPDMTPGHLLEHLSNTLKVSFGRWVAGREKKPPTELAKLDFDIFWNGVRKSA